MKKETFLEVGENIQGFEIVNPQDAPEGLTPQILWDLWDIGVKFGRFGRKGIGFKALSLHLELFDFRDNGLGGIAGMFIAKTRPSCRTDEGVFIFDLKNGISVTWDRGFIRVDDIQEIVKEVDDHARSEGMIANGSRLLIVEEESPCPVKMNVETIFKDQGVIIPVIPITNANKVLNDFDRPDLLDVVKFDSLGFICLKSEKDILITEYRRKMQRLSEMGIGMDDVAGMSTKDISILKEKL